MSKEIKGDRQRNERIDIPSSLFGSLREEENDFKAGALMKEKDASVMRPFRGGSQMNEWLKGSVYVRACACVCGERASVKQENI